MCKGEKGEISLSLDLAFFDRVMFKGIDSDLAQPQPIMGQINVASYGITYFDGFHGPVQIWKWLEMMTTAVVGGGGNDDGCSRWRQWWSMMVVVDGDNGEVGGGYHDYRRWWWR